MDIKKKVILMKDIIEAIGRNAGKIWENLNANGSLPQTKLIRNTKLKNDEFHIAIGWLARENKIEINEDRNQQIKYDLKK